MKMEWINVKDKVPQDLEEVLFTDKKEVFKGYRISSDIDGWFSWCTTGDFVIYDTIYWMPLPEPPKE